MQNPSQPKLDIGSDQPDLAPASETYARRFEGPVGEWLLECQTRALRELISPWPFATVLDVGGGHGQIVGPLLDDGHTVSMMATSEDAIGRLKAVDHPNLIKRIGPLSPLPYPDASFDVVTSFRMFAHVEDWRLLLGEMCRVAKHAVIFDFPIPGGANAIEPYLFWLKKRIEGDTRRYRTIRKKDVSDAIRSHGFEDISSVGQFVLPMVLHRKIGARHISRSMESVLKTLGLASVIGTPIVMRAAR